MSIGKKVKEELKKQGKSVAWLARETGIPATTLRSAFSKDRDNISIATMQKISKALGVTLNSLTDGKMSIADVATSDSIDFESDYIIRLFALAGFDIEPLTLKDNSYAFHIYGNNKKALLTSEELHELVRGSKEAATQYVKDALKERVK